MQHQYIYGRCRDGYRQINDLSQSGYTSEDLNGFQQMWMYQPVELCEKDEWPECRYYYVSQTTKGDVIQIGRTLFVPGGSSNESGIRDSTLLHKYIIDREKGSAKEKITDFEYLMNNSDQIFCIDDFFSSVEEAKERGTGCSRLKREKVTTGKYSDDVLRYFSISDENISDFLYAVLYAMGSYDARFYIALPDWSRKGSDMALQLCGWILRYMPPQMVPCCGFISYSSTFHDSQMNLLPRKIKLVFFPNDEVNKRKYRSILRGNYIWDPTEAVFPQKDNLSGYRVIDSMKKSFMNQKTDPGKKYLNEALVQLGFHDKGTFSPESLEAVYRFYLFDTKGKTEKWESFELYDAIDMILACNSFDWEEERDVMLCFLKKKLASMGDMPDEELLYLMDVYYYYGEPYKSCILKAISVKLLEACNKQEMNRYRKIMELVRKLPDVYTGVQSYVRIKDDFWRVGMEEESWFCLETGLKDWQVFSNHVEELLEKYPRFLFRQDVWKKISDRLITFFDLSPDIDKLVFWYILNCEREKKGDNAAGKSPAAEEIRYLLCQISDDSLEERQKKEKFLEKLRADGYMEFDNESKQMVGGQEKDDAALGRECIELLRGLKGEEIVSFFRKNEEALIWRILPGLDVDLNNICEKVVFEKRKSFFYFYKILFESRKQDWAALCERVLDKRQVYGGARVLKKLINVQDGMHQYDDESASEAAQQSDRSENNIKTILIKELKNYCVHASDKEKRYAERWLKEMQPEKDTAEANETVRWKHYPEQLLRRIRREK